MSQPRSHSPRTAQGVHWPSLVAAYSAVAAVGLAIGLGLPLFSIILEKRGIAPTLIGLNVAMAGVASMLAAPLTTRCARRFGVVRTMMLTVCIAAVSAMGFFYATDFWMWFPLRIVFHGATAMLFILSEFWINDAAPRRRRGLLLGIYATLLAVGFAAGPLLFSQLGSEGILPFLVGAGIILSALVPLFFALGESPVLSSQPRRKFFHYIVMLPSAMAAVFVFGAVSTGGLSLLPIYALRSGLTEAQAAILLTVMGLGNMLFQIPLGLISDRLRDRRPLLASLALLGLAGGLCLPLLIGNWLMLAVMLFFWGGCVSGLYTLGLAHLGARLRGADLAAANAAFIFCYAVGTVIGPQAIGLSMDLAGNSGFAMAIAGFFGLYAVVAGCRLLLGAKWG